MRSITLTVLAGLTLTSFLPLAWALDDVPHLCDPSRHWLSGHAIWHLLSAGFLLQIELFYRQFDSFADVTK